MSWFVMSGLAVCVIVLTGLALSSRMSGRIITRGQGGVPVLVSADDAEQERQWREYGDALGLDVRRYTPELEAGARIPDFVSGWELMGERGGRAVHVVLGTASFSRGSSSEASANLAYEHRYTRRISVECIAGASALEVIARGDERVALRADGEWLHWDDDAPTSRRAGPHPVWGNSSEDASLDIARVSRFLDIMLERAAYQEKT